MTPANGTYTAVVDRIVGEQAVCLVEEDGTVVDEVHISVATLPVDGDHEGTVIRIEFTESKVNRVIYDQETTEQRHQSTQERFDRLSRRPNNSSNSLE